jgi:hypothetical protein
MASVATARRYVKSIGELAWRLQILWVMESDDGYIRLSGYDDDDDFVRDRGLENSTCGLSIA